MASATIHKRSISKAARKALLRVSREPGRDAGGAAGHRTPTMTALLTLCVACLALLQLPARSVASTSASGGVGGASAPSAGSTAPGATAPSTKSSTPAKSTAGAKSKAKAKAPAPKGLSISGAVCVPAIHCSTNSRQVSLGGELLIKGTDLRKGMEVAFPHSWDARIASNSPTGHLASSSGGMVVHVPSNAHSGR
ncbi:MAG TPA: hypothetical protein VIJ33_05515, partial [Solirubrobacteraceae bacterium]